VANTYSNFTGTAQALGAAYPADPPRASANGTVIFLTVLRRPAR